MIREVRAADAASIATVFKHYVRESVVTFETAAPTSEQWALRISDAAESGFPFVVAEIEGRVVGYAYASPWRPKPAYQHTVEDTIYLAPGYGGKGLGGALLAELLIRCADYGFREVIAVIADTGNPASVTLHRSLGFTEVGVLKRVGFKLDQWVDTIVMQRSLIASPTTR